MFFDSLSDLVRVLVVGPLAYVWLLALLRLSGKRTLAQLNAFDFVVTVALGSTLATVVLSGTVAWTEGALALALLALLQFAVAWASVHLPWFQRAVTSAPTVLVRHGELDHAALARQRISPESVHQRVRASGIGGLELVAAVVLESNGTISVIPSSSLGSGSSLPAAPGGVGPTDGWGRPHGS